MNVTGILWTFYPLLGLMAFIEFGAGLAHIFFCLPFFAILLPCLCGIVASIASVYALLLHYPNKTELLLQFISWLFALALLLTTTIETICLRRSINNDGSATELSVCEGILNRTTSSRTTCNTILISFQNVLFEKLQSKSGLAITELEYNRHVFSRTIAMILATASLIHLCCSSVLTLYSALANRFKLSTIHWQFIIGILTLAISYIYNKYCCIFFHTYFITAIGFFSLIQTLIPCYFSYRTIQRQLFSIIGAGLSITLLSITTFGLYCWSNRYNAVSWHFDMDSSSAAMSIDFLNISQTINRAQQNGLIRYCYQPEQNYMFCERRLQFSTPYIWWSREQVQSEAEIIQIVVYCWLTINSMALFFLFIYEAFC